MEHNVLTNARKECAGLKGKKNTMVPLNISSDASGSMRSSAKCSANAHLGVTQVYRMASVNVSKSETFNREISVETLTHGIEENGDVSASLNV